MARVWRTEGVISVQVHVEREDPNARPAAKRGGWNTGADEYHAKLTEQRRNEREKREQQRLHSAPVSPRSSSKYGQHASVSSLNNGSYCRPKYGRTDTTNPESSLHEEDDDFGMSSLSFAGGKVTSLYDPRTNTTTIVETSAMPIVPPQTARSMRDIQHKRVTSNSTSNVTSPKFSLPEPPPNWQTAAGAKDTGSVGAPSWKNGAAIGAASSSGSSGGFSLRSLSNKLSSKSRKKESGGSTSPPPPPLASQPQPQPQQSTGKSNSSHSNSSSSRAAHLAHHRAVTTGQIVTSPSNAGIRTTTNVQGKRNNLWLKRWEKTIGASQTTGANGAGSGSGSGVTPKAPYKSGANGVGSGSGSSAMPKAKASHKSGAKSVGGGSSSTSSYPAYKSSRKLSSSSAAVEPTPEPSSGTIACTSCGLAHQLDARFCGECGTRL